MLLVSKSQVKDVMAGLDPETDTNNLQHQGGGDGVTRNGPKTAALI